MDAKEGGYLVQATWDDEAKVWVAESENIPGLATEAPSEEVLIKKLTTLIPELLELNHCLPTEKRFEVVIRYQREDKLSLAA